MSTLRRVLGFMLCVFALSQCSEGEDCPEGAEGCACAAATICDPGLMCLSSKCVALTPANSNSATGTVNNLCSAIADKVNACDRREDRDTLFNQCFNEKSALTSKLRSDVVSEIIGCIGNQDCAQISMTDFLGTCQREAAAKVAPSAVGSAYCDQREVTYQKCNLIFSNDKAECLSSSKLYNDATLMMAVTCLSKACSDVSMCIASVLVPFVN